MQATVSLWQVPSTAVPIDHNSRDGKLRTPHSNSLADVLLQASLTAPDNDYFFYCKSFSPYILLLAPLLFTHYFVVLISFSLTGSFGEIHLTHDTQSGEIFATKLVHKENPNAKLRLEYELYRKLGK